MQREPLDEPIAAPEPAPLAAGTRVGVYEVVRLLGHGGMAEVYLARDRDLGRRVALKVIRLKSGEAVERLLFEARTIARFSHPHIVTVYGVGEVEGRPYVALEYLEGQNLRERMAERRLGVPETVRIGLAVASALEEAHRRGVLHRDLKPENVVIPGDGRLRVVDFGLAKRVGVADPDTVDAPPASQKLVSHGGFYGTPAYMAPEQWVDEPHVAATDLWAFGVLLYELGSGRLPFDGPTLRSIAELVCGADLPKPLEGVPEPLAALIFRCFARDAGARPTAAEAVAVLDALHRPRVERGDESPFRGLLPFTERHAATFFGRDGEIDAFVERLRLQPVLAVVGPSGAGKSSFVRAGVVPRLTEQEAWVVLTLRPGARPFGALAARLLQRGTQTSTEKSDPPSRQRASADDPSVEELAARLAESPQRLAGELAILAEERRCHVLLFVDQLEELFTTVEDVAAQRAFLEALATAVDDAAEPVRVVFTVRDDFLGRLAMSALTRERLRQVTLLQGLDDDALREGLVRPLALRGFRFDDPELPARMVAEVHGAPGGMPLVQFAAQILWERRDTEKKLLTTASYEAIGGVTGALARHADGVLAGLDGDERQQARQLLLRLVTPARTRRVLSDKDALEGIDAAQVRARLVEARLLSAARRADGEAVLELTHESLITGWATLRRWIDESEGELVWLEDVGQAASLWDRRGRRATELWEGEALHDALRMLGRCTTEVPEVTRRFLEAGERRSNARRRNRRLLGFGVMSALAALALFMALQKREADGQRRLAESRRREAEVERADAVREGARAALEEGSMLEARAQLRLALELADEGPAFDAARALWWRMEAEPLRWKRDLGAVVYDGTFSADDRVVGAACQDGAIYLFDTDTAARRVLRGASDQLVGVAFSPDGRWVAGGGPHEVLLWPAAGGAPRKLGEHRDAVYRLVFDPDGQRVYSASGDGSVRAWPLGAGESAELVHGMAPIRSIAVRGNRLAAGGVDGAAVIVDTTRNEVVRELRGPPKLRGIALGDGFVALGGADLIQIFPLEGDAPPRTFHVPQVEIWDLGVSPDGRMLVSAGNDGRILLWDVASGTVVRRLLGHGRGVLAARFSADGSRVVSAGFDYTVRVWDVGEHEERHLRLGHTAAAYGVAFDPRGRFVASAGIDGSLRLWDLATGDGVAHLEGVTASGAAVDPAGELLATGHTDGFVRFWSLPSLQPAGAIGGDMGGVPSLVFTPDGTRLAVAGGDGSVRLWDVKGRRELRRWPASHVAHGVALSPDAALVASADEGGVVTVWDAASGAEKQRFRGHEGRVWGILFSPDGRSLYSGGTDGTVRRWELESGTGTVLVHAGARVHWMARDASGAHLGLPLSDGTAWIVGPDGTKQVVLRGHVSEVNQIAFDAAGERAATSGDDGTVRLWRVADGRPIWHAPLLLPSPPRLYAAPRGWRRLDGGDASPPEAPWREEVEHDARYAAMSSGGDTLCIQRFDDSVAEWRGGERVEHRPGVLVRLSALDGACAGLVGGRPWLSGGAVPDVDVTSLDVEGDHLLASSAGRLLKIGRDGAVTEAGTVPDGAVVTARSSHGVAAGFANGNLEVTAATVLALQHTPASRPLRLLAGPRGTWIAGFANGFVGIWDGTSGVLLESAWLHGQVVHLVVEGGALHAATELGTHLRWSLATFDADRCALLDEVWRHEPAVWDGAAVITAPPPASHACRR
jgi:WD40 repeat protein/serine/threonine protein kinase